MYPKFAQKSIYQGSMFVIGDNNCFSQQKMADDWKLKLENGELLPLKLVLTEEVLEEIGIGPDEAQHVLEALRQKGRKTWGTLLDLEDREETIKLTGDEVSGKRIWNFVQEQKTKAAAASKLSVFM